MTDETGQGPAMPRAKQPVGPGRITLVGVVLAVLTVALGVVGIRDALISSGALDGTSTVEGGIDLLDGLEPQWWAVAVGVVLVLVGLWLLLTALRPRPRTAVALTSKTGVFLRPSDVRKIAQRTASDIDGVLDSRVRVGRRAASMSVSVTGDDERIAQDVESAVSRRLAILETPPRIKISLKPGEAP